MMNKLIASILVCLALLCSNTLLAQETREARKWEEKFSLTERKGDFFFYWGYNRTSYAKSDIHLVGKDYDFTLSDVEAKDLPKEVSAVYFDPAMVTVPQFNIRFGYFINNKYAVAIGWDHMKYQTIHGKRAKIDGTIGSSASSVYAGTYNNQTIVMNEDDLVKMEHSDGFNIVNLNIERHDLIYNTSNEKLALNMISGAGLGIAIPWTNSFIFGKRNDDRPHFSGMGAQAFVAPEALFYKRIFLRFTAQVGFANMWDIATTPRDDNSGHAEQTIYYFERSVVLGFRFKVFK